LLAAGARTVTKEVMHVTRKSFGGMEKSGIVYTMANFNVLGLKMTCSLFVGLTTTKSVIYDDKCFASFIADNLDAKLPGVPFHCHLLMRKEKSALAL
jgi:hypothetical protein